MARKLSVLVKWNISSLQRKKKAEGFVEPTLLNTMLCTTVLVDYLEAILDAKMTWGSPWDKESEKTAVPFGYVLGLLAGLFLSVQQICAG
jgi:hypothetical protein